MIIYTLLSSFFWLLVRAGDQDLLINVKESTLSHYVMSNKAPYGSITSNIYHNSAQYQDRNLEEIDMISPLTACASADACLKCFYVLDSHEVDWVGISADTSCTVILDALQSRDYCVEIKDQSIKELFCNMFESVVKPMKIVDDPIDCSTLTECKWGGMNPDAIGDGVCNLEECYNTPVCKYDGGDCCFDTCNIEKPNPYISQCGTIENGRYYCIDPSSKYCDPTIFNSKCKASEDPNRVSCLAGTTMYKVTMYDSFGDGWGTTNLTISESDTNTIVYNGQLTAGAMGVEYFCLTATKPMCYRVELKGGFWGREISWDIRGYAPGAPALATGGAPMNCQFGIAGARDCESTCTGQRREGSKGSPDWYSDDEYVKLKDITSCINNKCFLQVAACNADDKCRECFQDIIPDWCFTVDSFSALTECSTCKCSSKNYGSFCATKVISQNTNEGVVSFPEDCSATQKRMGGTAMMKFTQCSNFTAMDILLQDYDNDQFGLIDKFEACSFNLKDEQNNMTMGSAMGCMQILVNAMHPDSSLDESEEKFPIAIAQLATALYTNGESFCECSSQAYNNSSFCPTFRNFNSLLYEALEACNALDTIDCEAWNEFAIPCKANLIKKVGSEDLIDFKNDKTLCNYVKDTCGGAGPFPSFRRLDCADEVSKSAWEFYTNYAANCLPQGFVIPLPDTPNVDIAPTPPPRSNSDDLSPPVPFVTPSMNEKKKQPYVPPEERVKNKEQKVTSYVVPDETSQQSTTSSHWFRNFFWISMFGFVGYIVFQRRHYSSNASFHQNHPSVMIRVFETTVSFVKSRLRSVVGTNYSAQPMNDESDGLDSGFSINMSSQLHLSALSGSNRGANNQISGGSQYAL